MTQHARQPDRPGWALKRLLDIHDGMRNDLTLLQRAVTAVTEDGQEVDTAAAALGELSFRQPGWTLRRFCAGFCGFVHEHHATEDTMLFPMLLQQQAGSDGALDGVVDRLRAEHRTLTGHLDEVERALGALPGDAAAKTAAAGAMARLSQHLEAHLRLEEERLAPALNAMSRVVTEDEIPPPPARFGISGSSSG
jgi:Hemerythrin HHE cation binding domain